eukprot:10249396-Ditylum_brightwellii.AAC.1
MPGWSPWILWQACAKAVASQQCCAPDITRGCLRAGRAGAALTWMLLVAALGVAAGASVDLTWVRKNPMLQYAFFIHPLHCFICCHEKECIM